MVEFTETQWEEAKDLKKGRITHEYVREGKMPRYKGSKTIIAGRRMLVEGIDFRVEYSLI